MNRKESIRLFFRILKYNLKPEIDMSQFATPGSKKLPKGFYIFAIAYLAGFAIVAFFVLTAPYQQWFQLTLLLAYDGVVIGIISLCHHIRKLIRRKS